MIKGVVLGIAFTVALAALALFIVVKTGAVSANADQRVPRMERWAAKTSLRASLQHSGAAAIRNPLPVTNENLLAGIKLYAQDCAICHGAASGEGSDVAKGLYQDPPQFHREGVEDDPAGIVYWKIAHGLRWTGMPAFGKTLSEKQLWQLTLFLQKMDHLTPVAQHAWRQVHVAAAAQR